ncbi:MAG: tRNA pseudouridine(55) synthase TruB [Candidatus Promineifilaceae bacterium]
MPVEGLLLIDKPIGPTSFDVIARLRRLSDIRRIGHAGTLDPLASGLLLVCVGRATRLLEYLSDQSKRYEATLTLGRRTDTFDAEGVVLGEKPIDVSLPEIERTLERFRGPIVQRAPAYSAVKRDGVPLYKLARQGVDVERPTRDVIIHDLELRAWERPELHLTVFCSSGTYIRSLADDIGHELGCGAYLSGLRRTAIGSFSIADALRLEELDSDNWQEYLQTVDTAARHLPVVIFAPDVAERVMYGQRVPAAGVLAEGEAARAYDAGGRFLGIVLAGEDVWQPHKMFPQSGRDGYDEQG